MRADMRILRAARTLIALGLIAVGAAAPAPAIAQPKPAQKPAGKPAQKPAGKPAGKPAQKPAHAQKPQKPQKGGKRPAARKPGEAGEPDEATRRIIAGTAGRMVRESPELKAMRELDLALFPTNAPSAGAPWPAEG